MPLTQSQKVGTLPIRRERIRQWCLRQHRTAFYQSIVTPLAGAEVKEAQNTVRYILSLARVAAIPAADDGSHPLTVDEVWEWCRTHMRFGAERFFHLHPPDAFHATLFDISAEQWFETRLVEARGIRRLTLTNRNNHGLDAYSNVTFKQAVAFLGFGEGRRLSLSDIPSGPVLEPFRVAQSVRSIAATGTLDITPAITGGQAPYQLFLGSPVPDGIAAARRSGNEFRLSWADLAPGRYTVPFSGEDSLNQEDSGSLQLVVPEPANP